MNLVEKVRSVFSSRLARDTMFQFLLNLVGAAVTFFQLPLLLKIMGGQGFGEWVIFQTMVSVLSILTLIQFFQGMVKYVPNAPDADKKMGSMLRLGLINEVLSLLLILSLTVCFKKTLCARFPTIYALNEYILLFVACTTSLSLGQTVPTTLRLLNKYQYVVWWSSLSSILRFILLLLLPGAKISSGMIILISFIVPEILRYLILLLLIPRKILLTRIPEVSQFKEMVSFSLTITIQEWFDLPVKQLDKLILSAFVQPVHVGVYQIIRRIGLMMGMLVTPFTTSFFHEFSERFNKNDLKSVMTLFKKSVLLFTSMSIGLSILLISFQPLWVPRLFVNVDVNQFSILLIIAIYIPANGFNSIHSLLNVLGGIRESLIITIITNVLFFVAALFLGYLYHTEGLITALGLQIVLIIVIKMNSIRRKYLDCLNLQTRTN